MINKAQEVREDEEFKDNSDYSRFGIEKSQKVLIKLKNLKYIKKSIFVRHKKKKS